MDIHREYQINLSHDEEQSITAILSQSGVVDGKEKLELFKYVEERLWVAFMNGVNEANRLTASIKHPSVRVDKNAERYGPLK